MAITASQIIERAAALLLDRTKIRWPAAELLDWLNDGRRELAAARPDVYAVSAPHTLAAGTKQSIPVDGTRFLDVLHNINGDNSPGRAIAVIERETLDAIMPNWHRDRLRAEVRHFAFDERTPRLFHVWPPAEAGHRVELAYSRAPQYIEVDEIEDYELDAEDLFAGALVDYLCYRAHLKDADHAGNLQRATAHYAQFAAALGLSAKTGAIVSPNTFNQGGTPPKAGA